MNFINEVKQFINKYDKYIIIVLLILNLQDGCGGNSTDAKTNKELVSEINVKFDSLKKLISIMVTEEDLHKEGLRVEKRMIQSCDRKILDVNRQSQIDKELNESK